MKVTAELAASVWKINVTRGAAVARGDVLMLLESMKMEIPVEAPADGQVTAIYVVEGGSVQEGEALAEIEPDR
jgi:biotin carboxyl carrier protein